MTTLVLLVLSATDGGLTANDLVFEVSGTRPIMTLSSIPAPDLEPGDAILSVYDPDGNEIIAVRAARSEDGGRGMALCWPNRGDGGNGDCLTSFRDGGTAVMERWITSSFVMPTREAVYPLWKQLELESNARASARLDALRCRTEEVPAAKWVGILLGVALSIGCAMVFAFTWAISRKREG